MMKIRKGTKKRKFSQAQVIMEFMFTMIVVLLMIFSLMMVFRWGGFDLVNRRLAHENKLEITVNECYGCCRDWDFSGFPPTCNSIIDPNSGPQQQLDTYFYKLLPMNAIWQGN